MIVIPMMRVVELADAAGVLAEYAKDPSHEPVILAVKGKPVAVVLSAEGGDVESISVSLNPQFLALMERSRKSLDTKGGIPIEEVRRRFGLPPYVEPKAKTEARKPKRKNRKVDGKSNGSEV